MARTDQRRIAADARRIAKQSEERATEALRGALRANYDRGKEAGREEVEQELHGTDARRALLDVGAEVVELLGSRLSAIPNSNAELRACRESAAILREVRVAEEVPSNGEGKPEVGQQTEKRKAKG